jgi:signal transduction histidine kinase
MPRHRPSPIATRLARVNMLASGAALVLACLMLMAYDVVTFRDTMVRNRSVQAQIIGSNTVTALTFDDPRAAQRTLAALSAAATIEGAAVYRPDGELFASYLRPDMLAQPLSLPDSPPGAIEWHAFDGLRRMHLLRRVVLDGVTIGTVYIRTDLQEAGGRLKGYGAIVFVVLLVSLLAANRVSRVSTRAISAPITALVSLATRLSQDRDYSVRATMSGEGELAILIASVNEMLGQIQERDRSLQESHDLLEQRVQERTKALDDSNAELEAFCYSVSHDLRSPLRSIDGFSHALLDGLGEQIDAVSADHLRRIRAATQRMGTLIDDLLSLARITRIELVRKPVDLSALALAVVDDQPAAVPSRVIKVVIGEGLQATGDPRLLRQVFENLIGNAWKFTSKRAEARIEFGAIEQTGNTVYFVKDNGAGFDPAYAERLFGMFQRLHPMAEFPGTGVGLAIVHRIVKRHGGRVWAESMVGRGATFYFTLVPSTADAEHAA